MSDPRARSESVTAATGARTAQGFCARAFDEGSEAEQPEFVGDFGLLDTFSLGHLVERATLYPRTTASSILNSGHLRSSAPISLALWDLPGIPPCAASLGVPAHLPMGNPR